MPDVSFIIVSYNTAELTLQCLRTLKEDIDGSDLAVETIVVDNLSTDDTVERIRTEHPWVRIVTNQANLGFGAGNNRGMLAASSELLVLLNSDAFVRAGFTRAAVEYLTTHPDVGMAGPLLLNRDLTIQRSVFQFPTPIRAWLENLGISYLCHSHPLLGDYRRWSYDQERDVEWVSGACMMTRRSVFREGGFDETFFMYSEETDWQLQIRRRGWRIAFTPGPVAVHLGGGSGPRARLPLSRHFFRSLDLYVQKNHGRRGWISFRLAMVVGAVLRIAVWALAGGLGLKPRTLALEQVQFYSAVALRQTTNWSDKLN